MNRPASPERVACAADPCARLFGVQLPNMRVDNQHPVPVAQYARMSTEHQKYSIANQEERIAAYAAEHEMTVVKSYRDLGKSGVTIRGRQGLQDLIRDIKHPDCEFCAVLVFDVSRWGRFQDTDESAFYEYVCKQAGAPVVYCEEAFTNYDGPMTAVIKSLKRAMAAEFSRELSAKVFAGQHRLIQLGYWQGGPAGYAMRRIRVAEDGKRYPLHPGQRKVLQTDRVVVAPGLPLEVRVVRKVFRWFVFERLNEEQIARRLNRNGFRTQKRRYWIRESVSRILSNEVYAGTMTWSRTSMRLGSRRIINPPQKWVRGKTSGPPVISQELFDAAQRIITSRKDKFLDQRMLDGLRALFIEMGCVSSSLIDACPYTPFSAAYRSHFGSIENAYTLAGVPLPKHMKGTGSKIRDVQGRFRK